MKNDPQIIAIVQARLGSTRLPGKILKTVNDKSLLKIMIDRVSKSRYIDEIVVATTTNPIDIKIIEFCKKNDINFFVGSENDVLSRYNDCALKYKPDTIVRLTSDCPLIDPNVIDLVVKNYLDNDFDYVSNTTPPDTSTYPDGSDVEVFSRSALIKANKIATDEQDREHVTFLFWRDDSRFSNLQIKNKEDWSQYRFTLDYPEDFEVIKFLVRELSDQKMFGSINQIISILNDNPHIKKKNKKYYSGISW